MPIELYLIGGSKGESVVIRFPDDKWGVVDCYTSSTTSVEQNRTYRLLRNKGVRSLDFVCMTHAHDDHVRGLRQILESFDVNQFWRPAVMDPENFKGIIRAKLTKAKVDKFWTNIDNGAKELGALYKRVDQLKRSGLSEQRVNFGLPCIPLEAKRGYTITAIGPSSLQSDRFESQLNKVLSKSLKYDPNYNHRFVNQSSIGLLIEFGKSRILLGGDIESEGWSDVCSERSFLVNSLSFVKVAHHGSDNGYCDGLWKRHVGKRHQLTCGVTAFHTFDLPYKSTLDMLRGYNCEVFIAGKTKRRHRRITHPTQFIPFLKQAPKAGENEGAIKFVFNKRGMARNKTELYDAAAEYK